jgi:hypothetical protein
MKLISRRMATAVTAVALALAALAGSAAGAGAASAATTPVVYAAHLDPWHGYVKPSTFYFGNGGAPELSNLTWKSWGSGSAWGTGKLWTIKPGCHPVSSCRYYSRWVGVYLNTARLHGTTRYYARMAIEFFVSGKARWQVGWYPHYNCSGCPAFWGSFPNAWPYF